MYLVSKHGRTLKKNEKTENDNFTVLDVHRPTTSISIEEVLVEKVVEFHKSFCSHKNPVLSIFDRNDNTSTLNAVRTYIRTYNTITDKIKSKDVNKIESQNERLAQVADNDNNHTKSELNDADIYFNSPLRKKKENEEEIERHRKARQKSGRAYNENEVETEENEITDVQESNYIQISVPLLLFSLGVVGILSFLVGKSSKFR